MAWMKQIKCTVVGDGMCGKTFLIHSCMQKTLPDGPIITGFEEHTSSFNITEGLIEITYFDTSGRDDYDRLRPLSYSDRDVFLICFSLVEPDSLENITEKWYPEVHHLQPKTPVILVGTKAELVDDEETVRKLKKDKLSPITTDMGLRVQREIGAVAYVECSAITQQGREALLEEIVIAVCKKRKQKVPNSLMDRVTSKRNAEAESKRFIKAIEKAIAKSGKISRRLAHSIVIGPPGSGKSSLIDRLLGRLRKHLSLSTGVCDSVVIVDIDEINPSSFHAATGLDEETWKEVDYEVSIVNQLGENIKDLIPLDGASSTQQVENVKSEQQEKTVKHKKTKKPKAQSIKSKVFKFFSRKKSVVVAMSSESVTLIIERHGFEAFKNYLQKTFSLYLRDTGGQVEFQEMLPILIFGPSIFFFVFRVDLDFQSKFTVEYRTGEGESINSYTSSITTEEALLQCLASVYAMDTSGKERVKVHKPLVFIIGTHVDKLGSAADSRIAELNEHIDKLLKKSEFNHLVQYADNKKNQVFFPVDNTSDRNDDLKLIRSNVNSLINGREEFAIEYPASYLLLCLDLQNETKKILSLEKFRVLAAKHGIEGDDVFHLLQFLHLRIGIVRYYDVDGLRDIVVIEPQVLFNTITDLVVRTFSCKSLTSSEVSEFEKKGLFTASILKAVVQKSEFTRSDTISAEKFVKLLVHLRIITPFAASSDQEVKYFIPCVLNHVPESKEAGLKTNISPLAVKFLCHHCPKGVFAVLVTHLMTPEPSSIRDTTFSLIHDKIFKDQVSFEVVSSGFVDELSLTVCSTHLEVKFFPGSSENRELLIEEVCCNVREILEESIILSLRDLHYGEERAQPEMSFKCHDCHKLHSVTKGREFHRIYCSTTRTNSRLPPQARCWYGEKGISEDAPDLPVPATPEFRGATASMPGATGSHLEQLLDWDSKGVDRDLIEISEHMLHWEGKLSVRLGLTEVDVHDIKVIYPLPSLQRSEALRRWKCKQGLGATYGNLLDLFVKAGHTQCAEAVREVLRRKKDFT